MTEESVAVEKKPRRIAIVGTAEPHWRAAPYANEDWEIWTCGGIFSAVPRTTRHFELHDKAETCKGWGPPEAEAAARNTYWEWIAGRGADVVLKSRLPETPDATEYPLDRVLRTFPDRYFTNSISYMIALALVEGVDELGMWGIDMALTGDPNVAESNEYARQRPSVEFHLGIAVGSGVKLTLPKETTLLQARKLYGFEGPENDDANRAMSAKVDELANKLREVQHMKRQIEIDEAGLKMAKEVATYAARNFQY